MTLLNQLRARFESLKEVRDVFEFLKPELIIKSEESKTIKSCYDFVLLYKSDVGSELISQILSLKEIIVNKNLKSIRDLATFIVQHDFSTSYSDVFSSLYSFFDSSSYSCDRRKIIFKIKTNKKLFKKFNGTNALVKHSSAKHRTTSHC